MCAPTRSPCPRGYRPIPPASRAKLHRLRTLPPRRGRARPTRVSASSCQSAVVEMPEEDQDCRNEPDCRRRSPPAHELRRLRYRHHPPQHPSCIPAGDRATGRGCARSDDARLWKGFLQDLLPLHDGQANTRPFRPRLDNCSRSPSGRRRSSLPCRRNPDAIPQVFSDIHVDREERRILDNEIWPKARSMDWIWRVEYRFYVPCLWPRRIADGRPDRTSPIRNPGRQVDRVSTLSILQLHAQPLFGALRRHQSGPILRTTDLHGDARIP